MKRLILATSCFLLLLSGALTVFYLHRPKPVATHIAISQQNPIGSNPVTIEKVIADINKARQDIGVAPLVESSYLDTSAAQKCADMAQNAYYAHINPTTGMHGYQYAMNALPYSGAWVAENLNLGSDDEQWMIDSWLASPEHKAAILNPEYTITGVAKCSMPQYFGEIAVVEHFASSRPCANTCADNTCSSSSGSRTCSWHGGEVH